MRPKRKIRGLLEALPKNATSKKTIAPVEIGHKVRQGLADVKRGAIVSLADAESRLNRRGLRTSAGPRQLQR